MTFEQGTKVFTVPGAGTNCVLWGSSRGGRHRNGVAEDNNVRDPVGRACVQPTTSMTGGVTTPMATTPVKPTTTGTAPTTCGNDIVDEDEECEPSQGACVTSVSRRRLGLQLTPTRRRSCCTTICTFVIKGSVCRRAAANAPCDVADTCDGQSVRVSGSDFAL